MNKLLNWAATAVLAAALLGGCAPQNDADLSSTTATAASTAETTTAEAKTEETIEPFTAAEEKSGTKDSSPSDFTLRIGSMKGPTSMGLVSLMDRAAKNETKGSYDFTMVTAADELMGKLVSGQLDIALIPANMASILYQKSNAEIRVIDINTLGVLSMVSGDSSIQTIKDLKGKTIYLTGKGTTPDYVLQYLLSANGLSASDVTLEYKAEATEVASVLKNQPTAVGLLPQPFVTVVCAQNEALQIVIDLTKEWDAVEGSGSLVTGVTVCRTEVLDRHSNIVHTFMEEHKASAAFTVDHVEETAKLVVDAGIIEKAPIAAKALPYCGITYVDGEEMKTMLDGYLRVLFGQNPEMIGSVIPDDAFYYIP